MRLPFFVASLALILTGPGTSGGGEFQSMKHPARPVGGMESLAAAAHYPETARRDGLEGLVRLRVDVDAGGHVKEITVSSPVRADLDSAAVRAERAISWEAAQGEEGTLPCQVEVPVRFKLDSRPKP